MNDEDVNQILIKEQRRVFLELHDGLGQGLSALNLMAKSLQRKLRKRGIPEARTAAMMTDAIRDLLVEFRTIIHGLNPISPGEDGLRMGLERLCERIQEQTGIACQLNYDRGIQLTGDHESSHWYRIAQEAIANGIKHARPTLIKVSMVRDNEGGVRLEITDNGQGFRTDASNSSGSGIQIMAYRSRLVGANFHLESTPGTGTTVTCYRTPLKG